MTPEELSVISDLINKSAPDMGKIRDIVDEAVEKMEGRLEKVMDGRFQQLEDKIDSSTKHSEDMVRSRVSDKTCEHHRENSGKRIEDINIKLATIETAQKTTGRIVLFVLGMLIPALIGGVVYGIITYQQVQSLLP